MGKNDDLIWVGTDHKNREVVLSVDQRDHIIDNHFAMSNNFTSIYDTVKSPNSVYKSAEFEDREVFFGKNKGATYETFGMMTKVIVEYVDDAGRIVTAFPVRKEGGNIDIKIYPED